MNVVAEEWGNLEIDKKIKGYKEKMSVIFRDATRWWINESDKTNEIIHHNYYIVVFENIILKKYKNNFFIYIFILILMLREMKM